MGRSYFWKVASVLSLVAFLGICLFPAAVLGWEWAWRLPASGLAALGWAVPSPRGLQLLFNSLLLAGTTTLLASLLGTSVAMGLSALSGFWRGLGQGLYLLPLLIPPYLHALGWMSVAGRRQGLEQVASLLVGPDRLAFSAYGFWPAALVLALSLFPIVTLFTLSGLQSLEPELLEEASLLRPGWPVATRILFPLILPWVVSGAGLVLALSLLEYGVPSVLQYNVYSMEIYAAFSQDNDPVRAGALATPLVLAAACLLGLSQLPLGGNPLRGVPGRSANLRTTEWPALPQALLRPSLLIALLSVVAPVLVLLSRCGSAQCLAAAGAAAPRELLLSLTVAAVGASLASAVATPLALALVQGSLAAHTGWLVCALPMALPAPLMGIGLILVTGSAGWAWSQDTPFVLVWGHLARLLPFAVFAAASQLRRVDPLLVDAAQLHDVGWWRRLARIELPLVAPALVLAWLVVFALSLGELGVSLLVAPPGQATLPMRIYNLMHYGASDVVAGLALLLLGLVVAFGAIVALLNRRLWPWAV